MTQPEEPLPAAYCAPGRKAVSELALTLRGERYAQITEHPWLEGLTDVWLMSPDAGHLDVPLLPPLSREYSLLPWWYQVYRSRPASPVITLGA